MKYILNNSILCHRTIEDGLIITITSQETIHVEEGEEELLTLLDIFSKPTSYEEAFTLVNEKNYISEGKFQEIFELLRTNNILKEYIEEKSSELSSYQLEKYKRQISSFNSLSGVEYYQSIEMQKKICNSCICIVGIGGTGSHLALTLASIGVEELILVDFDSIELSNTSRQVLYSEEDIGKLKMSVAEEKLKKYNSNIKITTYNVHIESEEDYSFLNAHKNIRLLILCADTPRGKIQYFTDDYTKKNNIPWLMYGPFHHYQILVGPYLIPNKTRTYSDIFKQEKVSYDDQLESINKNFVASICDPYNGFASQFVAIEILKILTGFTQTSLLERRYYINTNTWVINYVDYAK